MSTSSLLAQYPMIQPLAWTLVHFLWQGTLVAFALAAVLGVTRRQNPNVRYVAALIALAALAILPIATASVLRNRMATPAAPLAARPPAFAPVSTGVARDATVDAPGTVPAPALSMTSQASAFAVRLEQTLRPAFPWVVATWLAGITLLSLFHVAGWWGLERLRRRSTTPVSRELEEIGARLSARLGVRRPVRLLQSALVAVPAVAGWAKPVVLIPVSALTGMGAGELESVIAHELAHVRRHDYLVNLIQAMVEIVLFYHPAVWWVSRQVRVERELCCDDLAVAVCGDAVRYARALAHLEGLRGTAPRLAAAATSAGRGTLLERIRRLVGVRPSAPEARFRTWFVAALGSAALLSLAATTPLLRASALPIAVTIDFASPGMDSHDSASGPGGSPKVTKRSSLFDSTTIVDTSTSSASRGEGHSSSPGESSSEDSFSSETATSTDDPALSSAKYATSIHTPGTLSGEWRTRERGDQQVEIQLHFSNEGHNSSNGFDVAMSELVGYAPGSSRQFEMNREAGTLHFVGTPVGDGAHGTFTFSPNPEFRASMASMGYSLNDQQVYECAALDLTTTFVRGIEAAGQHHLPFDRLVEFRIHRVTGDFIKELASLGYPNLSAEKLVEFRIHGVTPDYVRAIGTEGYRSVSPERLVEFRIHGVKPELLRALANAGYREVPTDRVVEFAIHGVTPEFLKALSDAGYTGISAEKLVEFRIHGVDPQYLKALREAGYDHLSSERLVEFRIHGVDPQELKEYSALGYAHVSDDTLVNWRIHGVRPEWLREINATGYKNIDPETLVEMRIHGVDAAFIREMESRGHRGASIDEMIRLRIHEN